MSHKSPAHEALTDKQRESLDRAMDTVRDHLDDDQRVALIEHSVMVAIRYATEPHSASVLHDWSRGLLATLRMHASPVYREAVALHTPPDPSRPSISAAELLARFERRCIECGHELRTHGPPNDRCHQAGCTCKNMDFVPPPSEMPEPLPDPVVPDATGWAARNPFLMTVLTMTLCLAIVGLAVYVDLRG